MLEVCVDSLDSAINAINGGADELEVCSALSDGGLTPSMGLVLEIMNRIKKLPVEKRPKLNVMIRHRGGNDFYYSNFEMQIMLEDIQNFKDKGVDQFVFGALNEHQEIDETNCLKVIRAASPKKVTFSRAFDLTKESKKSAGIVLGLGFYRVLTSGHHRTAADPNAIPLIKYLVEKYSKEKLIIMPGSGITPDNVGIFIKMGSKIVHSSCGTPVALPKLGNRFRLGVTDKDYVNYCNYDVVCQMKAAIAKALLPDEPKFAGKSRGLLASFTEGIRK